MGPLKAAAWNGKHGISIFLGKRNVLRLKKIKLKESREGFCPRGRTRPFHIEGPKTEKGWEPTMEISSLVQGIWKLRVSEAERRVREGV